MTWLKQEALKEWGARYTSTFVICSRFRWAIYEEGYIRGVSAEVKIEASVMIMFLMPFSLSSGIELKFKCPPYALVLDGHHLFAHRHRQRFVHTCEWGGRVMKGGSPVRVKEIKV